MYKLSTLLTEYGPMCDVNEQIPKRRLEKYDDLHWDNKQLLEPCLTEKK